MPYSKDQLDTFPYGDVGAVLQQLRRERGLTQRQVDALEGIDHTYISRLERGHVCPQLLTLYRLAFPLQCSVREMIPAHWPVR